MVLYWTESVQFIVRTGLASCRLIHQLDLGLSDNVRENPFFLQRLVIFSPIKIDINLGYNAHFVYPIFRRTLLSFKLKHNYMFIQVSYHRTWPPCTPPADRSHRLWRYSWPLPCCLEWSWCRCKFGLKVRVSGSCVASDLSVRDSHSDVPWCATGGGLTNYGVKHQNEGYNKQLMVI